VQGVCADRTYLKFESSEGQAQSVLGRHQKSSKEDTEGMSPLETEQDEISGRGSAIFHAERKCVSGPRINHIAKSQEGQHFQNAGETQSCKARMR
jgi:hypothetical protein